MAQLFDPETVRTLAEQMARTGNIDPTGGNVANNTGSPFEQQLALLAAAEKTNPRTALGVLLGEALAGGINGLEMLEGSKTQSVKDQEQIQELFKNTYGKPTVTFSSSNEVQSFEQKKRPFLRENLKPYRNK